MKTLLKEDVPVHNQGYGPDPVLMKKKGISVALDKNLKDYKKKINDDNYMEHAIDRIAMELSHFLAR